jgi:hypothetical protein
VIWPIFKKSIISTLLTKEKIMTKFTYREIEEVLLSLDEIPKKKKSEKPGSGVDYLLSEGRSEAIDYFFKENGFTPNKKGGFIEVNLDNLPLIKSALEEIETAYSKLNKEKPKTYANAYRIFGQWGLLSFTGVGKHPHFSDDGVEYASGYPLRVIKGIEGCLKNRKNAA